MSSASDSLRAPRSAAPVARSRTRERDGSGNLPLSRLTLFTFGGFEIRRGDRRLGDFESWRARALAAFLVAHPGQTFGRDRLAHLLWPEWEHDAARRNLRQALYDLRRRIEDPSGSPHFLSDAWSVRFEIGESWLDLGAFQSALADHPGDAAPKALAEAVRLYRGEFLAGLEVGGNLELEEWLIQQQERLREGAVASLRRLVDHYLATGGYSVAIQYARRLLDLEPLSDETHRQLMRLYSLTGRRNRALAQFGELRDLLARELDVEPLAETESLYQDLRRGILTVPEPPPPAQAKGPLVPLAGRARELARLHDAWNEVARGRGRITLVHGDEGIGKTRLMRAALDRSAVSGRATVVLGRFFSQEGTLPYAGLRAALEAAVAHEAEARARLVEGAAEADLRHLARLGGSLRELAPGRAPHPREGAPAPSELGRALAHALPQLAPRSRAGALPGPTVLLLDDVDRADAASLAALDELAVLVDRLPLWLLVGWNGDAVTEGPGAALFEAADRIALGPLSASAVGEIAAALVGRGGDGGISALLSGPGGGRPLLCSELVNLLWDRRVLAPRGSAWALVGPLGDEVSALSEPTLEAVVVARFAALPPTARRLIALAAVVGPRFDIPTLCAAEGEDERVVEATLRLLLERWWLRVHLGYWADSRHDRDLTLWTSHGRGCTFEFGHEAVRRTIYAHIGAERRSSLHARVVEAQEGRQHAPSGAGADRDGGADQKPSRPLV